MFYPMQIRIYIILILGLFLVSCNDDSKLENEIAKIDASFVVERFDIAEVNTKPSDLQKLKDAFPFMFSRHTPDSIWVDRLNDTLQHEILQEVNTTFKNFNSTKVEIERMFQHIKYYDELFSIPRVVTLTNYVQYRDKVIVTDSIALISLDNYLNEDHKFYVNGNIPQYLAKNFNKEQIVVNLTEEYAKKYTCQTSRRTLLDEMIYFGKLLYFKDKIIPFKTDPERMGYTDTELKWAEANESSIWSNFIENELLFSTDPKLPNRFLADAPFSKFGLNIDNDSPGRLGQYIGWQIVKAYAEKTGEDVMKVMQTEPEEIFRKSKFKPKK
jgi:gliding motility-associated lipoprotein GldB